MTPSLIYHTYDMILIKNVTNVRIIFNYKNLFITNILKLMFKVKSCNTAAKNIAQVKSLVRFL